MAAQNSTIQSQPQSQRATTAEELEEIRGYFPDGKITEEMQQLMILFFRSSRDRQELILSRLESELAQREMEAS